MAIADLWTWGLRAATLLCLSLPVGMRERQAGRDLQLFQAVENGDQAHARKLLEGGANPNAIDKDGLPVIWHATRVGSLPMVVILLKSKANPNLQFSEGHT